MPARWKFGLALFGLILAGRLAAAPLGAQALIARCAFKADAQLKGISALDQACPGLRAALDQSGLTALLPSGWPESLTAPDLADLAALSRRYAGATPSAAPPTAALLSIATALIPPAPPSTWSGRILSLIQHWTGPMLREAGHWLRSIGPAIGHSRHPQAVFYGLTALLLIAVAVVLAFELRGTGILRLRRLRARLPRGRIAPKPAEASAAQSGEPDWMSLREQPAGLLRLLIDALTRARRLERDRHLTCRELEREARFDSESERAGFARVTRLAERALYGPPGTAVLSEDVLRDAQQLHARLLAAAGQGGSRRR